MCGDVLCDLGPIALPLWTSVSASLNLVDSISSFQNGLKWELKSHGELLKTNTWPTLLLSPLEALSHYIYRFLMHQ